jgi:cyclopropane-fatty-acyl-phospholipid synthase
MATKTIIPKETADLENVRVSYLDKLARNVFFPLLKNLKRGKLTIKEGDQEFTFGQVSENFPLEATVRIHHPRSYSSVVFDSSIGAGRSYMEGYWSTDNLTNVVRLFVLNQAVRAGIDRSWKKLTHSIYQFLHFLNRNTREGSRSNIISHYDLGNDFYKLFLDETMTYSCGIFETAESTLKDASIAKYDRICQKLRLRPEDHVVEIGTGWGSFAVHAVKNYGCRMTTTTISNE